MIMAARGVTQDPANPIHARYGEVLRDYGLHPREQAPVDSRAVHGH